MSNKIAVISMVLYKEDETVPFHCEFDPFMTDSEFKEHLRSMVTYVYPPTLIHSFSVTNIERGEHGGICHCDTNIKIRTIVC